ncbi:MAG TPA: hypothetical protein VLZ30_09310 [Verrucomicrobiae bacterium]|nr:hypothetical protein [Verrucomicrobiae bacterium]
MKKAIIAFVAGLLVASLSWYMCLYFIRAKYALEFCAFVSGEPELAHKLLVMVDNPSPDSREKAVRAYINIMKSWIRIVDSTDHDYPFLKIKERLAEEYKQTKVRLSEYEKKVSNNSGEPTRALDGASGSP